MNRTLSTLLIFLAFLLSSNVFSCGDGEGFLPENDLHVPVGTKNSNMTERQFNHIIDRVKQLHITDVALRGERLVMNKEWSNPGVNAYAHRNPKRKWELNITMWGGLARHYTVTSDAFALVVCHELGHHIAGSPKKLMETSPGSGEWVQSHFSNEGQSDYFATLKCLRKVFAEDVNVNLMRGKAVPITAQNKCEKAFWSLEDQAICKRTALAAESATKIFSLARKVPFASLDLNDHTVVASTDDKHPAPQCRLDTMFSGAVCNISHNRRLSLTDQNAGTCNIFDGFADGLRPRCWYLPSR